jgi:outer membrane biosynthesis protein TonB
VVLVAIGLTAVAGLVMGRSGGSPVREVTAAAPPAADGDAEPVARAGRLSGDDAATPSPTEPAESEPPVEEVADEPAPAPVATAAPTATPARATGEPSATEDTEPARCTDERGSARGRGASGSRRAAAACR